jgi:hypothetical protein
MILAFVWVGGAGLLLCFDVFAGRFAGHFVVFLIVKFFIVLFIFYFLHFRRGVLPYSFRKKYFGGRQLLLCHGKGYAVSHPQYARESMSGIDPV